MKIAVLNLPFDNNYGGNLQRYALVKVLQRMGHQVEHIDLQLRYSLPWFNKPFCYAKRIVKKMFCDKNTPLLLEKQLFIQAKERNILALNFYEKYVPHTQIVYSISEIRTICAVEEFNAYVVGSDQVWRKEMTWSIGLENYFLKFTYKKNVKRIAYAVSMGTDEGFSRKQVKALTALYKNFDAVSVREYSALHLLEKYGWNIPRPIWAVDPTLLLQPSDYQKLVDASDVVEDITSGKIFCYVIDTNSDVDKTIRMYEQSLGMSSVMTGLADTATVSIEQWLCNLLNCSFVITDSYHGTVFSILFNKPFVFVGNERRGNARVDSLFKMLDIKDVNRINWTEINKRIEEQRNHSISFLQKSLQL